MDLSFFILCDFCVNNSCFGFVDTAIVVHSDLSPVQIQVSPVKIDLYSVF